MFDILLEPERNQDLYAGDTGGYVPGENGDETGSPYYTIDFSGYGQEGTVVKTVQPETQQVTNVTQDNPAVEVDAEKKRWYDVVSQLGGTAAGLVNAIKSPGIGDPNYNAALGLNNGTGYYAPIAPNEDKNAWVWILLAIIIVAVLMFLAFKKDK